MSGGGYRPNINSLGLEVPSKNSVVNADVSDVVGNKTDDENGNSLYSLAYLTDKHDHSVSKCYPSLSNGVTVTGGAGAWVLGDFVEVVPASTITSPFDIHWINISSASAADEYELHLYYGDSDTEAGCIRMTEPLGAPTVPSVPFQTPLIPANSKIRAKLASSTGGADTITFSINYHIY